ncbi:DUF4240 domain-containing protein [Promicromonospora sp. NPDC059942]|uniref:DUF4240 domain-containing protein n=1 Tax=Promicromonospora sp. NPDC059942 TaxID=3347009 RepID=UPI00364B4B3F
MDVETVWRVVDEVRARAEADGAWDHETLSECVVDVLAGSLSAPEIVAFCVVATALSHQADTQTMAAAMFLIEGYVSDDTFMDFRDGLILLGRSTFEAATADPDLLVEHPLVDGSNPEISFESISSCAVEAWSRVTGGADEDDFWDVMSDAENDIPTVGIERVQPDESWDLIDAAAIRRQLPRLAERFSHRLKPRTPKVRLPEATCRPTRGTTGLSAFHQGVARGREAAGETLS